MLKTFITLSFCAVFFASTVTAEQKSVHINALPPDTGASQVEAAPLPASTTPAVVVPAPPTPRYPTRLLIPSLSLNDSIVPVGTNSKGEMDVPDGSTKDVGWYKDGTVPGEVGSAVLDAHVFAAFAKLKKLKIGDSVYVMTDTGTKLHFVVTDMQTYALADVPADELFNRADTARLNLITCAGSLTRDRSTYDHRLVIYTQLQADAE